MANGRVRTAARLTDLVDAVYVINLAHRTDRRAETMAELAAVGLDDPGRLHVFAAVRPDDAAGFPSPGLRGCFESHLAVLREAEAAGHAVVLVAEDDIAFAPRFRDDEAALVELLATEAWDLVQIGWGDRDGSAGLRHDGPLALERYTGEVLGSHCYLVRGAFVPALLAFLEGLAAGTPGDPLGGPMSPDGALNVLPWRHPEARRLVAVPSLVDQRPSASDVSPRWFDRIGVARPLLRLARRAKQALEGRRAGGRAGA